MIDAAISSPVPSVNGVALQGADERLDEPTLRQRACTELLRQAATAAGLAGAGSAGDAIERLLERDLALPEPGDEDCRRLFDAQPARWGPGDRLHLRHVLFAVTPGVDVVALRRRAEALLVELRCAAPESDAFALAAAQWSNCPSGDEGGQLGWLERVAVAPEFARAVFDGTPSVGVLPQLVHSRHGLHIVDVIAREVAAAPSFEAARGAVASTLRQQAWVTALRRCLQALAGRAQIVGVSLDAAA